jgi:preprotein translocase subunit YajC
MEPNSLMVSTVRIKLKDMGYIYVLFMYYLERQQRQQQQQQGTCHPFLFGH